jgi:hypothetical protein
LKKLFPLLLVLILSSPAAAQLRRQPYSSQGSINGNSYSVQRDQWGNTYTQSQGDPVFVVPRTPPGKSFQGTANGQYYWGQTDRWGNTQIYTAPDHKPLIP